MASPSAGEIDRRLGRLFSAGSAVGLTDGELIKRFTDRRGEPVEAAFETILARHGGLVWTVRRQVLGDAHAAEDAFQATFLVLVRRAASLRVREQGSLGPWLHGVAYRIALKARQGGARRRTREHRVAKAAVETIDRAEAEVPAALRTATVAAAMRGTPAAAVAALTKLMLKSLIMARIKMAAAAVSLIPPSPSAARSRCARTSSHLAQSPAFSNTLHVRTGRSGRKSGEHSWASLGPVTSYVRITRRAFTSSSRSMIIPSNDYSDRWWRRSREACARAGRPAIIAA
jgi:DNA-directed RNA polymerase specialized sigma24 family protein